MGSCRTRNLGTVASGTRGSGQGLSRDKTQGGAASLRRLRPFRSIFLCSSQAPKLLLNFVPQDQDPS